ncbi:hypothetical protein ACIQH6_14210 [Micromonospora orduensis]|uniref:hypothetical protein n=1 Tax=Micromonospora orduensis TaxID=1420891 RepID=UPI003824994F
MAQVEAARTATQHEAAVEKRQLYSSYLNVCERAVDSARAYSKYRQMFLSCAGDPVKLAELANHVEEMDRAFDDYLRLEAEARLLLSQIAVMSGIEIYHVAQEPISVTPAIARGEDLSAWYGARDLTAAIMHLDVTQPKDTQLLRMLIEQARQRMKARIAAYEASQASQP